MKVSDELTQTKLDQLLHPNCLYVIANNVSFGISEAYRSVYKQGTPYQNPKPLPHTEGQFSWVRIGNSIVCF